MNLYRNNGVDCMINNNLNTSDEFLELFGTIPPLLTFDEAMYDIDLSVIASSL